jgi:hypothetical protein
VKGYITMPSNSWSGNRKLRYTDWMSALEVKRKAVLRQKRLYSRRWLR